MIASLASLLAFTAVGLAAFGMGRPAARVLCTGRHDALASGVWSGVLGLIAGGTLWTALGMLGILYAWLVGLITMAACFWAAWEIYCACYAWQARRARSAGSDSTGSDETPEPGSDRPSRIVFLGVLLLGVSACLGSFTGALAPPTAGDALCYHLELPKIFLADHAINPMPDSDNSTFPLMTEMWFLWGLAMGDGVTAQLVHWGAGVLLGLVAVVLATPIIGRPWAWIAGVVVVLVPGINNQMTAPLNDVALALLTTASLAAWYRATVDDGGRRWFVVAGLAAGGAMGTKYTAALFAAAVAVCWAWGLRSRRQRWLLLHGAAVVAVVASSVAGVWYARAAWYRGNPVYPFANEVFAAAEGAELPETRRPSKAPLGYGPLGLVTAPWQVTMHPERFGGRGHQLGLLLLVGVPGLLYSRRLRGLRLLLGVSAAYFIFWYLLRQNVRFLFPIVPPLAVAVVWGWMEMRRFPPRARQLSGAVLAAVLLACAALPWYRTRDTFGVALGWEDREEYLLRTEPTFPAAAVANCLTSDDSRILSQDYRAFYFDSRITRENVYRRRTGYDRRIADPADLSRVLKQAGFTHLLLAETVGGEGIGFDPTLSRLVDAQRATPASGSLVPITQYHFKDTDGAVRRYRLIMLR